jgi:hypothetical protein
MVDNREKPESAADHIRRIWAAAPRRTPLPRGVMKFRSIEEAKAFRDAWNRAHESSSDRGND